MEPHMLMARAEAQRWVGIAEKLLTTHDLVGSKTFAIRARESDPRLETANQILAITDTLLAAEQVVIGNNGSQQPDLYGILQLDRFDQNTHNITLQYHRLALILNPNHNHFPYSDQAFHLVNNAWTVLSNPIRKSIYDSDLGFTPHHQHQHKFFSLNHHQSPDSNQFQHHIFLSPFQVNSNNVNIREPQPEPEPEPHAEPEPEPEPEPKPEHKTETEIAEEDVDVDMDDSPTFWTTCPYCFYMYEHHRVYVNCTLRCDNCKRAYQAVQISSPPPILQGQEAYFCSWGFFPIGISMAHLQKRNDSNWMPFSTFWDVSSNVKKHRAAHKGVFVNKNLGPRIYIDDEIDDIFVGVSEPSDDDSDTEWNNTTKRKKVKRMNTRLKSGNKQKAQVVDMNVQEVETSQKDMGVNTRSRQQSKELGKLDLNVGFNNNEAEEPATTRMTSGNRGNGQGAEDNIEGNGFFEGLDEFLNSLPILSVVNEEKVKAG